MKFEPHSFVLKLPELVDLNTYVNAERRNRFLGAKIKKQMTDLVYFECLAQRVPKMTKIEAFELLWHHKNRKKDFDNVEFGVKWIKDGLVHAGKIENDGWKHFPPKTTHQHFLISELDFDAKPGVWVCITYV